MGETSWITADNSAALWAFLMVSATLAIVCEQRFAWAARIPGAVVALLIGVVAANVGFIPTDAPVYDAVWGYVVPLAVPLLLFQTDVHRVAKESWRLLLLFLISSAATMCGAVVGFLLLRHAIPELAEIASIITASYSGGGVNFAAMTAKLEPSSDMVAATIVADNLMMAVYFIVLLALSSFVPLQRWFGSRQAKVEYSEKVGAEILGEPELGKTSAAAFWRPQQISLLDIALSMATASLIVAVVFALSAWLKTVLPIADEGIIGFVAALVADKWLLLPIITFAVVLWFRRVLGGLKGSRELGTYLIYIFFVVIGVPASIGVIVSQAPLLFVFVLVVAVMNLLLTLLAGKLLGFSLAEAVLACNANIGGPTTAAALAISKGWTMLVGPIMVIGTLGYAIGNYLGVLVYRLIA